MGALQCKFKGVESSADANFKWWSNVFQLHFSVLLKDCKILPCTRVL